jgi:hypothetical protein
VGANHGTVVEWYQKLREHICECLKKDPIKLGESTGASTIEIDESLLGKKPRKVQQGNWTARHVGFRSGRKGNKESHISCGGAKKQRYPVAYN